ncbi:MAG: hypothetical protein IPN18_22110 [Ignavibacteriales bacterium]|nr:hypothetical protein [Ignavibacteriales bacterium]
MSPNQPVMKLRLYVIWAVLMVTQVQLPPFKTAGGLNEGTELINAAQSHADFDSNPM